MKNNLKSFLLITIIGLSCAAYALPQLRQRYNPSNYTTPGQVVDPGAYDEEGHCIYARVVVEHAGLLRYEYQDRPDLAGQGMPKKKKSAWKKFIGQSQQQADTEEDVKRECESWHKNKNDRALLCERLLQERWGDDALKWARTAMAWKYGTRIPVALLGALGSSGALGPASPVTIAVSTGVETAWAGYTLYEANTDRDANKASSTLEDRGIDGLVESSNQAVAEKGRLLDVKAIELGNKGQGGGLESTIHRYGPGKAGNFHNEKINAIYKEAASTRDEIAVNNAHSAGMANLTKALPWIGLGSLSLESELEMARLRDLEERHGATYRRCVEAINELKNSICPICGER